MKHTIILWAGFGFIVAAFWVLLGLAVPLFREPGLVFVARLTCPIVPISSAFHAGVKWYWVLLSNIFAYALIGLFVRVLMRLRNPLHVQ